jgi:ABC-type multidrug transport system fused ATPase/permease subunit
LLILDEATSALDVGTEAKLLEALRGLSGTLTMVVAAHRLSAVANCEQLIDLGDMTPAVKGSGLVASFKR